MLYGFIPGLGGQEMLLLLALGILLFGRKLPELGHSVGRTFTEFQKGMRGIEDEAHEPAQARAAVSSNETRAPQRVTPSTRPSFEAAVPQQV